MSLYMIAGAKHHSAGLMKERGSLTGVLDLIFVRNEGAAVVADFMKDREIDVQFSAATAA
jgi:hypothetical protein